MAWDGSDSCHERTGNPPQCTGGKEHYDSGPWLMDPDGLETLHSFFAQYPRYNTNVCIHHFGFYLRLRLLRLSSDRILYNAFNQF